MACTLALVCKETADWMRPQIWRTVYMTNATQAAKIYHGLQKGAKGHRATKHLLVRNVWIRTGDACVPFHELLLDHHHKDIGTMLMGEHVESLAIDCDLLSNGWLTGSMARPRQVLLLDRSTATSRAPRPLHLNPELKRFFRETTHLIIGEYWNKVAPFLADDQDSELFFASLMSLCVRFPASIDTCTAIRLAKELSRMKSIEQVIICIDNGFGTVIAQSNPVWRVLKILEPHTRNLIILPRGLSLESEWDEIIEGGDTIWKRASDPTQRKPGPETRSKEEDWAAFAGFNAARKASSSLSLLDCGLARATLPVERNTLVDEHDLPRPYPRPGPEPYYMPRSDWYHPNRTGW
ncbi:uncharacterized protein LAESUDRAFT_720404 [Laetiporus sulphureus 93-53]|uniref:Uncharacterized protein n=1 Tax=Laetiporus sulphureus 93-53 TaxID=1314785 RepID=A0A165H3Y1_9APHY|nr:uncharacterized protein LAESUDRAFT_720404 [Laetiporus sulphureus 93-53]KZT11208.1 hypothetical protein LAESUDRAFT_720404 [Laetiporus sulphureus 93-53]